MLLKAIYQGIVIILCTLTFGVFIKEPVVNFLKFAGVSILLIVGVYLTVQVVFFDQHFLDLVASVFLFMLYKLLPLLFGFVLTLLAIAMFIALMDYINKKITSKSTKTETDDNHP